MARLALVDRLVVMDRGRGRVRADGPRDELLQALAQQRPVDDAAPAASAAPAAQAAPSGGTFNTGAVRAVS